jgi:transposase-like protein
MDSVKTRTGKLRSSRSAQRSSSRTASAGLFVVLDAKSNKFSSEVRDRAVRMVQEHRGEYPSLWAAIESIAPKIGCVPQTLNDGSNAMRSTQVPGAAPRHRIYSV